MDKIEVAILNPEILQETRRMMAVGARLTQQGHKIYDLDDFMHLYNKPASDNFVKVMSELPHPTLQHLTKLNIVVVGASRRVLAQLTRHQDNVKFVSASLQYSNFAECADVVVPYRLLKDDNARLKYRQAALQSLETYNDLQEDYDIDNDAAGYVTPNGIRNVLIISATPFELKHMISQRVCRRNTDETRYVMLLIWEALYNLDPVLFAPNTTGPFCMKGSCKEGKFACGKPISNIASPTDILRWDYPLLYDGATRHYTRRTKC